MKLNRFALDQNRLEGLDAKPVQRGCAVEQDRMFTDHFVEDIPNLGQLLFDHLFCAFDRCDVAALFELVIDKRLKKLERHLFWQATLMQTKFRPHDAHRAASGSASHAQWMLPDASGS